MPNDRSEAAVHPYSYGCLLPVACCLLPVACCLLPAACCLLPAAVPLHPADLNRHKSARGTEEGFLLSASNRKTLWQPVTLH
jgi:hypothetical protein